MFQIVSLSNGEQEWLSNHLGHEIRIDKDYYRQHEGIVEIAKVCRVLMAVDSGTTHKYAGKSLSDIQIEGKCQFLSHFHLLVRCGHLVLGKAESCILSGQFEI
jgi:hypothetical protein